MGLFSHRKGIKPAKKDMQVDDMDSALRKGLWDALADYYWKRMKGDWLSEGHNPKMNTLLRRLWRDYFNYRVRTLSDYWPDTYKQIREYFFSCRWNEVYDFIEFVSENYPDESLNGEYRSFCNDVLKREVSAHRFVGTKIMEMTAEEEIAEVEEALEAPQSEKPVTSHLEAALDLVANRKSPDYRNSIKESISAVEALCTLISSSSKATLKQALKEIEKNNKVKLHPALKQAFDKLYGYTSGADGIGHALLDESHLGPEDAKFMLVSCSAFINYLGSKSSKAGIKL